MTYSELRQSIQTNLNKFCTVMHRVEAEHQVIIETVLFVCLFFLLFIFHLIEITWNWLHVSWNDWLFCFAKWGLKADMDILSLHLLKVNNWVEKVVSLAVIFFSFLAKRPNDVTIFVSKMRTIAQCSFCCGLILVVQQLISWQIC